MGWETINVNEVPVMDTKTDFEPVPKGVYTLSLLGAEESRFKPGALNITTAIEGGEYAGRRIFIDLPDPDSQPWAPAVLSRLVSSMGATMAPYSSPIEELNRIAQNGHSKFQATVVIEEFTRKNGEPGSKNKVIYRSFSPAA
jgi:hypothetical protein